MIDDENYKNARSAHDFHIKRAQKFGEKAFNAQLMLELASNETDRATFKGMRDFALRAYCNSQSAADLAADVMAEIATGRPRRRG